MMTTNSKNEKLINMAMMVAMVLLFTVSAFGAPVNFEKAQGIAQKHLERTQRGSKIKSTQKPQMRTFATVAAPYFVVEKEGDGFVIISGDDIAVPILGEVDRGSFDKENMPPALLWLLETYERQIEEAVKNGETQDKKTRQLWEQAEQASVSFTAPSYPSTLLSTKWAQGEPYNLQCPIDVTQRSVAGCVATAMAQIMNYWKHPAYGIGASEAYNTKTRNISIPSVSFDTFYDYASMLDSYTASSGTAAQRDAVSKLMYHCGVSVKMDYTSAGSGVYSREAATALTKYFDYDSSILFIQRQNSSSISANDWKDLILGQMENHSPVYYSGTDAGRGGHAFIIDGYNDVSDQFHLNWGWGGNYNGFFALTALNPDTYEFSDQQSMIINIMPNQGGNPPSQIKVSSFDVSTTETSVNANITAKINYGAGFSGKIGMALMSGNTVSIVLDSVNYSISNNNYNSTTGMYAVNYQSAQLSKQFGADIPLGSLTLQVVTKRGTDEWTPVGETRAISVQWGTYNITYNLNGGTNSVLNPATYTVESPAITLNSPTKIDYVFCGWYDNANLIGNPIISIPEGSTGNRTYWAKWIMATDVFYTERNFGQWYAGNGYGQTESNRWSRISGLSNTSTHSVAIYNGSGTGNTYNTSLPSVAHIYKDITFPEHNSDFIMTFNFRGVGEADRDYMTLRYSNTSSKPAEGSVFTAGTLLGTDYWDNSSWSEKTVTLPVADFSGKTMRLVFTWINDDLGGAQPPAAIDKVYIRLGNATVFIPVTGITDVPATVAVGTSVPLTGTVAPANATNKVIMWSIVDAGGTAARIVNDTLSVPAPDGAAVIVRATVMYGAATGSYTEDFIIDLTTTPSSSSSADTPSSSSSEALSSSSSDTPSSSSSEGTPIRLSQIATANQATQIYNGVNLQARNNAVIEVYNLKGDLINKQKFDSGVYTVSFGHLPKGMYIVKATFDSGKQILRMPVR